MWCYQKVTTKNLSIVFFSNKPLAPIWNCSWKDGCVTGGGTLIKGVLLKSFKWIGKRGTSFLVYACHFRKWEKKGVLIQQGACLLIWLVGRSLIGGGCWLEHRNLFKKTQYLLLPARHISILWWPPRVFIGIKFLSITKVVTPYLLLYFNWVMHGEKWLLWGLSNLIKQGEVTGQV